MTFALLAIASWLAIFAPPRARRRPPGPHFETIIDMNGVEIMNIEQKPQAQAEFEPSRAQVHAARRAMDAAADAGKSLDEQIAAGIKASRRVDRDEARVMIEFLQSWIDEDIEALIRGGLSPHRSRPRTA